MNTEASTPPAQPTSVPSTQPAAGWERDALHTLLHEHIKDRRSQRRWRIFKSLAWLAMAGAFVWALSKAGQLRGVSDASAAPHTALVRINGVIADDNDASAENLLPALREAMQDPNARALVLLINSPGGSPVQAGMVNDELRRLRKLHDKPIYAVVEETCASAAYYIAAAADKIYVDKASLVGSIGVLMDGFGFVGAMEKLGVERRLMTAGENKGFLDPFSPQRPEHREHAQKMLDGIHRQFIGVVREGRGERLKETPETFSGLFWTGEQAIAQGLADEYGSLDMVARDVVQEEEVVDYSYQSTLPELLVRNFGKAMGEGAVGALKSLPALR